jgi:hypothetical protein
MDFNLQQNVLQFINNRPQQSRSISRITPSTIDVIYIITWKNLHFYSSDNNQVDLYNFFNGLIIF